MLSSWDKFWDLVLGVMALNPDTFEPTRTLSLGKNAAFQIVILAGFSQAIGQAIVLFMNRVKPFRFILSLGLATILYAISYLFWVISTWSVINLIFRDHISFSLIFKTLGLSYSPEIFSFLVALPYLGVPISVILSIWILLAFLTGLKVTFGLTLWQGFWCSVLGWTVLQVLKRTIGKPVHALGVTLQDQVAGVELVTDLKAWEKIVETGPPKNQKS